MVIKFAATTLCRNIKENMKKIFLKKKLKNFEIEFESLRNPLKFDMNI